MNAKTDAVFPPPIRVGCRIWTASGYRDHGPMEGPKVNIDGDQGGVVTGKEGRLSGDLFTVRWDNGQTSKHYSNGLHCIGEFKTADEYEAAVDAIVLESPVHLTVGPQGGFREFRVQLKYLGRSQAVHCNDPRERSLWADCIEPIAVKQGIEVITTKLVQAKPPAKDPYDWREPNVLQVKLSPQLKKKLQACGEANGIAVDKLVRQWIEQEVKRQAREARTAKPERTKPAVPQNRTYRSKPLGAGILEAQRRIEESR